jgi:hypothetical protein
MFRPLTITAVLNGWIVQAGCQILVYQDRAQLATDLDAYLRDPDATEQRLVKSGVNRQHTLGAPPATAAAPREFAGYDQGASPFAERTIAGNAVNAMPSSRSQYADVAPTPPATGPYPTGVGSIPGRGRD